MLKKLYNFLNLNPKTVTERGADKVARFVLGLVDIYISLAFIVFGCYVTVGLCICAYYAVGCPAELAGAVAILAKFFP